MKAYYLIHNADHNEYRLTRYVTETYITNQTAHGWRVVKKWATRPATLAVAEAATIDGKAHTK